MKKEKKLEKQMNIQSSRQDTWVGIRPVVFGSKKYSTKEIRRENKRLCREYEA